MIASKTKRAMYWHWKASKSKLAPHYYRVGKEEENKDGPLSGNMSRIMIHPRPYYYEDHYTFDTMDELNEHLRKRQT